MARQPVHKTTVELNERVMDLLNFAAETTGRSKKSIIEDGICVMGTILTPQYMDTHSDLLLKDPCRSLVKPYSSQNHGDNLTCSLVCYKKDTQE